MIRLENVSPEKRELLWNIHQKYLYELTNYYNDEMDGNGNYPYAYFDAYFTEPDRSALLIYDDLTLIGFARLNQRSYVNERPDHVLAEFTIFPAYRRKRLGEEAAERIFRTYGGRWELKYSDRNAGAKAFWDKVTGAYCPVRRGYGADETVLSFVSTERE